MDGAGNAASRRLLRGCVAKLMCVRPALSAPSLNLTLNLTGVNRCRAEESTGHQNDKMTPRRCFGQKASSAVPPFRTRLRCAACSTIPRVVWSARVYSARRYEFYLRGIPALQPFCLLYDLEVSSFVVSLSLLNTAGNPTSAESGGILFSNSYLRTSRCVYHFHYIIGAEMGWSLTRKFP
jgi:hypothetical protein